MTMLPAGGLLGTEAASTIVQPSRTWKLDLEKGRVTGTVDGLEAMRQAVGKVLLTDRFRHLIYSADYGHELHSLIGSNPLFLELEVGRMLEEALLPDDRIERVENVTVAESGGGMEVRFTVVTSLGAFEADMEVRLDA